MESVWVRFVDVAEWEREDCGRDSDGDLERNGERERKRDSDRVVDRDRDLRRDGDLEELLLCA